MYQIWGIYNFWGHECRKNYIDLFWLQRRSKCPDWNETRTWRMTRPTKCIYQVWNWHLKTRRKKAEKSKTRKTNRQNHENAIYARLGTLVETDAAGQLCTKCEEFILIDEAMIAKNMLSLLLAESQTRHSAPPTECIYKVSYWYLKACWKSPENADGGTDRHTDGRTLPRHNTSGFFSNGRIKKKITIVRINWIHSVLHSVPCLGLVFSCNGPLTRQAKLREIPETLTIPTWITARACRTCRDACRDR